MPELPDGTFRGHPEYDFIGRQLSAPFTEVWLANWSALFRALYLPEGKLDLPEAGFTSPLASADLPPPGRIRIARVDGLLSFVDSGGGIFPIGAGGGVSSFLGLTDTPGSYAGQALQAVRVNAGETALEFFTLPGPAVPSIQAFPAIGGIHGTFNVDTPWTWGEWGQVDIVGASGGAVGWAGLAFGHERVGNGTGDQTSYAQTTTIGADVSDDVSLELRVKIPDNWAGFDATNALRIRYKISSFVVVGATQTARIRLRVYHPETGAIDAVVATATHTAVMNAYAYVTLTAANLTGVVANWAGKMLRIRVSMDHTVFGDGTTTFRLGELQANHQ